MAKFFEAKSSKRNNYRSNRGELLPSGQNRQKVKGLSIVRLSDDGRGVGSDNGKTIFVENALPGEKVDVQIFFNKSNYSEGLATIISEASPSRHQPSCEYFSECGGCHLQHIDSKEQQRIKLKSVLNKLQHLSNIIPNSVLPVLSGSEFYYRQRARLSVVFDKKGVLFGFRKRNSKEIITIKQCQVMLREFNQCIEPLYNWLVKHRPPVAHVEFSGKKDAIGVVIRHTQKIDLSIRKKLADVLEKHAASCWFQEKKASELTDINGFSVSPELIYSLQIERENGVKEVSFLYHPQDFIQANAIVNNKMVNQAIAFLQLKKDHRVADFFCGVGNFSVPLSLMCRSVIGVEGADDMAAKAIRNAELNDCNNVSFESANLFDETIVKPLFKRIRAQKIDAIVLDPPRAGAKVVCQNIKKIQPNKIVYISCEPNTFARDTEILIESGYLLEKITTLDMFPQTYHNEVISLFVLNKKQVSGSSKREFN